VWADIRGNIAGVKGGEGFNDECPHDEYPHDEYPHDEYPHDEYPHDECQFY